MLELATRLTCNLKFIDYESIGRVPGIHRNWLANNINQLMTTCLHVVWLLNMKGDGIQTEFLQQMEIARSCWNH